jgi:hypothetical protein
MKDHPPKTLSVPAAGRKYFDLGKNASYAAAARGEIPVIRIGSRLRVPVIAVERMLAEAGAGSPLPRTAFGETGAETPSSAR